MRWLLLALAACATEPQGQTLGDAAEELAFGQCSRWIRCGTETVSWDLCVSELVFGFCESHDCTEPYPEHRWDNVERCSAWYEDLQCGLWVEPCSL